MVRHSLRFHILATVIFFAVFTIATTPAAAQGTSTFTYQGYLTNTDGPITATCDLQFTLFDVASGGSPIGGTLTRTGVSVVQGVFSVQLDFGAAAFNGATRYLDIAVKCGTEVSYTPLTPRQALTAVPYALTAFNALTALNAYSAINAPNHWSLTGNAGTTPATQFIGTTDNQAFEVRVNNLRALRIEPKTNISYGTVPNVIAGSPVNVVNAGIYGATISGGGSTAGENYRNLVGGNFGTVSGGYHNTANGEASTISGGHQNIAGSYAATVSGGNSNSATQSYSAVGGGAWNTASNYGSTVGGGSQNAATGPNSVVGGGYYSIANGLYSTVGGGSQNAASGESSVVSGGTQNTASGKFSAVSGGTQNIASGDYSFAAGRFALANDAGAFLWADNQPLYVISPGPNTFSVRASGGIWLGTGLAPDSMTAGRFIDTSTGGYLTSGGAWTNSSDRALKANFTQIDPRAILNAVAKMPISAWNYTAEGEAVKHLGPTAQDFRAAFGLGQDDKSISTVDAAGVALAAIQALKAENDALRADMALLKLATGNGLVLPALIVGLCLIVSIIGGAVILRRR